MSAKTKRVERSQRFRRAWRGENRTRAVSPVVATLILILIAVAAAAALYLWLVVWQGNITGNIGGQHAEPTLTVGGSTSVYPFSSLATSWFEQNNSDVVISDNQGGTGAGMDAVCAGQVDIGASSTPQTVSTLESSYGCPSQFASTIQITTVAYDAVDVVVDSAAGAGGVHGLLSINYDTLAQIYARDSTTTATLVPTTIDGVATATLGIPTGALDWYNIPAAAAVGVTIGAATLAVDTGHYSLTDVATQYGTLTGFPNLIYDASGTAGTPCGFNVCAGGSSAADAADAIVPVERSDASGTTQTFEAKLLGATSATGFAANFAALGYSGCGSNNLLSDCGISLPSAQQQNGNPNVLSYVAGHPDAIGYASDGLARATSDIGTNGIIPFLALGQAVGTGLASPASTTGIAYGGVVPSTGATGTIAAGITASATANEYAGWRPFQFVSLEPYTGVAQEFVTFIMDPANNQNLASATYEVSVYSI